MPFEVPGESFPGSAFYYLEETPLLVDVAGWDAPVGVIGVAARASATEDAEPPLAAPPLRISGSDRDHARAQQCMAQAIYYEAASESDAGQRAVAQIVLNRVAHPSYPRTVCGVVYQGSERSTGCQFTFTCDGALARTPSRSGWARASRHAREALSGLVYAPVGTATHYHTLAVNPYWASSLQSVGVIGAHIFYRWPGAAGRPAAFSAGYAGGEPSAARARSSVPAAPLPNDIPVVAPLPDLPDGRTPAAPSPPAAGTQAAPAAEIMPQSGDVREEYANSGRWITRP
ncbi:cell wall hydrolase [Aurantiacibacter aquimixticola]|uniref:Cell wall hydrolase n=2 Tax=Aurantiacibacter aquimixticola TaxID=1958945 RepID=A0A419RWP0_9SPHN|nr:cell wall hydrolase [Aurantiacibacter aquimixticola]